MLQISIPTTLNSTTPTGKLVQMLHQRSGVQISMRNGTAQYIAAQQDMNGTHQFGGYYN